MGCTVSAHHHVKKGHTKKQKNPNFKEEMMKKWKNNY